MASRAVAELWDDGVVDIIAGCCLNFRGVWSFRGDLCLVRKVLLGRFSRPVVCEQVFVRIESSADQKLESSNLLAVCCWR